MKKIPTLFKRVYENHKIVDILPEVTPGFEWVLQGEGIATVKFDGSCCAIINGDLYKRYDAKKGKKPPVGAIACSEPDPVTGHWPHWVKVDPNNPGDMWFIAAYQETMMYELTLHDGTYEAVGPHFQNNPYDFATDQLICHGLTIPYFSTEKRTFESIRDYLESHYIEGIVFWKDDEPQCKIKRSDFGFEWNSKR